MSTTITLPKKTPIVVLCGVASPYLHSIKLTFVDDGHIIKVRKWYGNDRFGKLIGYQDLYFDGEEERAEVQARLKNGEHSVHLTIHNGGSRVTRATVNGSEWNNYEGEKVFLDLPDGDMQVEIWLDDS